MNLKKLLALGLSLTMATALLAGCGGTGVGGGFNCPHVATHDDGHQA